MSKYIDIIPSPIANTTTKARLNEYGEIKSYWITPNAGYVLHDKNFDEPLFDEQGNETGEVVLGFRKDTATVGANYDFVQNENEFYTVREEELPSEEEHFGIQQLDIPG